MKTTWYILLSATVFFFSCRKKDFPDTVPSTPSDFYFNGTVAGNAVSLQAGVGGYYMYSSYMLDTGSLYRFVADLRPAGCSSCTNSLKITINDSRFSSPGEGAKMDSSLSLMSYPLFKAPYYAVQFKSISSQPAAAYLWDFGDNSTSAQADPLHIYKAAGNYSVSLRINTSNGCQQYISNIEKIRYPAVNARISALSNAPNAMTFEAFTPGAASSYQWQFGDGSTSSSANPMHSYSVAGTYPVLLRVVDASHDTVYARYNVATQTNPMPCLTNYSITSVSRLANPLPFSNVVISWTDENGEVYTSDNMQQPAASSFKISSVEDYDLNERGERTKRIRVNFSCQVYNGARMKVIENAEAVVCVSYK